MRKKDRTKAIESHKKFNATKWVYRDDFTGETFVTFQVYNDLDDMYSFFQTFNINVLSISNVFYDFNKRLDGEPANNIFDAVIQTYKVRM